MNPFYSSGGVTLHQGDARAVVPHLPPGLTVTDPPYNMGYAYDGYDDRLTDEEYRFLLQAALKPPCVVIHYPEAMFEIATWLGPPTKTVAWVYNANTPRQWRMIAWFGITPDLSLTGQPYKNPDDGRVRKLIEDGREARLYDWWFLDQVKNVVEEKTVHPCQIPLALMKRILLVTPFDGPVIDPFAGSGTTLRAAKDLGREAIGVELSPVYAAVARERMWQEVLL